MGFLWELEGEKERQNIFQAYLTVEGSFDEAVNGVAGVFQRTSPVLVPQDHNIQETLIDPISKGTTNVMNSCVKSKRTLTKGCSRLLSPQYDTMLQRVENPSFVIDPLLSPKPTCTLLFIFAIIKGLAEEYPNFTVGFVHIDDVDAAHVLAMEEPKATGRIICSSLVAHWYEIIELLRNKYPNYPFQNKQVSLLLGSPIFHGRSRLTY